MDLSNETDLDNKNSLEVQNIWKFNASMIKKSHTRLKKMIYRHYQIVQVYTTYCLHIKEQAVL